MATLNTAPRVGIWAIVAEAIGLATRARCGDTRHIR